MRRRLAPLALIVLAACSGDDGDGKPRTCAVGTVPCGDDCVDLRTDEGACGRCGNACDAGDACVEGGCRRSCASQRFRTDAAIRIPVGESPVAATGADADGDGLAELAVADSFRGLYRIPQTSRGVFGEPVLLPDTNGPAAILAADLDEDGLDDLILGELHEDRVLSFGNTGDGSFEKRWLQRIGSYATDLAAGDLDGDGHLDLVAAALYETEVVLLRGDGAGKFELLERAQFTNGPFAPAIGDFDGDGRGDVAFGLEGSPAAGILYRRDAGYELQQIDMLGSYRGLAAADFDGDGLDDLAVSGTGGVRVLLGRPTGPFERLPSVAGSLEQALLVAGDVDGDGRAELVAHGREASTPTFVVQTIAVEGAAATVVGVEPLGSMLAPALVDLDGDRALDLIGATGLGAHEVVVVPGECL